MEEEKLYMPTGITNKKEYFKGFGREEFIISLKVGIITLIITAIYYGISQNAFFAMVFYIFVVGSTVIMLTKNDYNISPVNYFMQYLRFKREQKIYKYKYQDEWEGRE